MRASFEQIRDMQFVAFEQPIRTSWIRIVVEQTYPAPPAEQGGRDFTPEAACPCPQIYFDPILGNHVRTLPSVTLAYNTRLDEYRQDANGVAVQVTDMASGAARMLRAQYLVGCDGPSGLVRQRRCPWTPLPASPSHGCSTS